MNALMILLVAFQLPQVWQPKPQVLIPPKQPALRPASVVHEITPTAEAPASVAPESTDTIVLGAVEGPFTFTDKLTVKIPIQQQAHSGLSMCHGKGCNCPCGHNVTPDEATLCICLSCGCDCEHAVSASKLVPPPLAKMAPLAPVAAPAVRPTQQALVPPLAGPQYQQPVYYYTQPTYTYGVAGACANGDCGTVAAPRRGLFRGLFRGRW